MGKSVSRYESDFKDFQVNINGKNNSKTLLQVKKKMRSQMPAEHQQEFDKEQVTAMSVFIEQKYDNVDVVLVVVNPHFSPFVLCDDF